MLLSKTCDYGIRAALYVASKPGVQYFPIREISGNLNISFHFLTKILQKLTQHHIMKSFKGPRGGVALARSPKSITLMDIIMAIEEPDFFRRCLLGLEQCLDENPCPVHEEWKAIRGDIQSIFENTTLAKMTTRIEEKGYRIADLVKKPPRKKKSA
ncbi:MAG: Rrf2 family transcriptional regulator [Acidobacteriota bacterium]